MNWEPSFAIDLAIKMDLAITLSPRLYARDIEIALKIMTTLFDYESQQNSSTLVSAQTKEFAKVCNLPLRKTRLFFLSKQTDSLYFSTMIVQAMQLMRSQTMKHCFPKSCVSSVRKRGNSCGIKMFRTNSETFLLPQQMFPGAANNASSFMGAFEA